MKFSNRFRWTGLGTAAVTFFFMLACSLSSNIDPAQDPGKSETITPTPTASGGDMGIEPSSVPSQCDGLSGTLEMQILVGPAEAVGLEPVSIGKIPFSVESEGGIYLVHGEGGLSYQDTLEKEWGTYSVSLEMDGSLEGKCTGEPGSETLDVTVEMSGEQMVEVRAEGFQGDYPWEGTRVLNLSFPLEDGAMMEGEGWAFVLHLAK